MVWIANKDWEADWIKRVLLSGLPASVREMEPEQRCEPIEMCVTPGLVVVVGRPPNHRIDELGSLLRAAQVAKSTVIVFHLSDEFCDLPHWWYPLATLILRQYWCVPQSQGSNVVTIPCGVKTGWNYSHHMLSVAERTCSWSFYGNNGGNHTVVRKNMRRQMNQIPGGCASTADWQVDVIGATYTAKMCSTIFAACPRGFGWETFRFNEALECGAIPIVDDGGTRFHHYMPGLLDHVITTNTSWTHTTDGVPLAQHIAFLLKDRAGLERRRLATMEWYKRYKRLLLRRIQAVIDTV